MHKYQVSRPALTGSGTSSQSFDLPLPDMHCLADGYFSQDEVQSYRKQCEPVRLVS